LAVAQAECAFVASGGIDAVTVVDIARERITGTLPVGLRPVAVAVSGSGTAWVANTDEHTVSVLDLGTRRAVTTVPVGFFPTDVEIHPDGLRVYVADRRSHRLSVIDAATHTVTATIPTQGEGPTDIEITRDGTRAYVTNSFSNRLTEVDLVNGRPVGGVQVGEIPFDAALSRDETHAYTADVESGSVSVVRLEDLTLVTTIEVGGNPNSVAVLADGSAVYAVNAPLGHVSVIDTATNTVSTTIEISQAGFTAELSGLAFSVDKTTALTVDFLFANLFAIDTAAHRLVSFTPVGGTGTEPERLTVASVPGICPRSPVPLLTASIGATDVTVPLERADLLPPAGTLRVNDELLTYEGRQLRDAVVGVQRAVEGTIAAPHSIGTAALLVGERGDGNCDGSLSAADVTALVARIPSGDPGACGADISRDGRITESDLTPLVTVVFEGY
jgi:YVTN family beta-propeller protein